MAITITNILTIGGSTTFSGTGGGFTTKDYIQTVAGSTVTLKSGVTYTVTGQLTITGTVTARCVLKGDTTINPNPTGSVATGGTSSTLTTTAAITVPTPTAGYNWLLSQNPTNLGLLRRPVLQMNNGSDVSNISSFPVISSPFGASINTFTISNRGFNMSNRGIIIGLSAKFIHTAAGGDSARNINYVNTFDIDSRTSTQSPIKANNSFQNKVGVPNPNLWRTVNWDSVQPLLPNISVAYIE
jgi:hypothetical protein